MINKEKAREIADSNYSEYIGCGGQEQISKDECYKSALEMAEWKDHQLEEELNNITDWFNHIAQIAEDKKTLNGIVMKDSDAFDEIRCLAKRSAEYINMRLLFK